MHLLLAPLSGPTFFVIRSIGLVHQIRPAGGRSHMSTTAIPAATLRCMYMLSSTYD